MPGIGGRRRIRSARLSSRRATRRLTCTFDESARPAEGRAFYRNEHDKVLGIADRVPSNLWNFYALAAAGRSSLALGNLDAAERHLLLACKTQLCFGEVGLYEAHNLLAFLLGEFYLGQLAMRRGRKEEARRKFEFFLHHFQHSPARLPQIAEARLARKA